MGFYIQDDFWDALQGMPKKTQNEVFGALTRFYFTGEDQDDLKGASEALFKAFKGRVLLSKKKSEAGSTKNQTDEQDGIKRLNKTKSKRQSKRNQTANQNEGCLAREGEGEREDSPNGESNPPNPPFDDAAKFAAEALAAFNSETGQDVRELPGTCFPDIERMRANGRTAEDVRRVVRRKRRQWEGDPKMAQFIRPSTIFRHFEEYANEQEAKDDASDYAGLW